MGLSRRRSVSSCARILAGIAFAAAGWIGVASGPARAGEAEVGLTAGALAGTHDEGFTTSNLVPIPFPIVDASYRAGPAGIAAEAFPFDLPARETNPRQKLDTHLGFFDVMARGYVGGVAYAGAGELVYNQRTLYTPPGLTNASHLSGARFELGANVLRNRAFHASVDVAPHLAGPLVETEPFRGALSAPEIGSQTEFNVWYGRALPHGGLSYGIRYVNYFSHFPGGAPADHNVGAIPYVRYVLRFGRP